MSKVQHLEKVAKYLKLAIINSPTHRSHFIGKKYQYLEIEKIRKTNIKLLDEIENSIRQMKQ